MLCNSWVSAFGTPEIIIADPGGEFEGSFGISCAEHGIALLITDARAPWQNGRTERHGGEWKRQLKLACRRLDVINDDELEAFGSWCSSIRNRYTSRSGYSPVQRVFGFSPRLPNSLTSDDPIGPA